MCCLLHCLLIDHGGSEVKNLERKKNQRDGNRIVYDMDLLIL